MKYKTYVLEYTVHLLGEQRTEPYQEYGEGVAKLENRLGANSILERQAMLGLERCVT